MGVKRSSHLERILGRLDDLDSVNLAILVQRLARERSLLETVFNTIQEGILVVSEAGVIEYANAAAHRLIGLRDNDVGQALLWKVMPDLARSLNVGSRTRRFSPAGLSRELEITYPEKRIVRLYMVAMEEEVDTGERLFAVIITDITEDKVSTEELLEIERTSSIFDLAAGVAHEIGNPLNSIHIHLQLMQRQLEKLEPTQENRKLAKSLNICAGEVERLDGIITHFLHAIRPSPPDLQDVDLLDLLTEVLTFQGDELKNLGIHVEIEIERKLPLVQGDRNQLKQVFFNIIKNATEAMDTGGQLRITGQSDDNFVSLLIADTGVGIAQEDLARIFHPYYTSKTNGHGLGMMIVQRIMRDHGGSIGLDSRKDVGTVVTLQFPQKDRRVKLIEGK